jgi:hypothetical protein
MLIDSGVATGSFSVSGSYRQTGNSIISGSIAIGNIAASGIDGRLDAANDIVGYSTSDVRFKENIELIDNAIDKLQKIHGYKFTWKEDPELTKFHGFKGLDVGVIAQEIESVLPEVISVRDSGYKGVRYEKIIPLLIQAIKEQQGEIENLKKQIENKKVKRTKKESNN